MLKRGTCFCVVCADGGGEEGGEGGHVFICDRIHIMEFYPICPLYYTIITCAFFLQFKIFLMSL